jgi:TPP-dependent pyruvate/acetoin dehydrogenase alpha subunit
VPVATGLALGMRYKGINGVAFSYFGDGATSRGDWHEGVNFASVQKLPSYSSATTISTHIPRR